MRIFFAALFVILLSLPNYAHGALDCTTKKNITECTATAGCGWEGPAGDTSVGTCNVCDSSNGEYSPAGTSTCLQCTNLPQNWNNHEYFKGFATNIASTSATCGWDAVCADGLYFNTVNKTCIACPTHQSITGDSHAVYDPSKNPPISTWGATCQPNTYKITLHSNLSNYPNAITVYEKYDVGYSITPAATNTTRWAGVIYNSAENTLLTDALQGNIPPLAATSFARSLQGYWDTPDDAGEKYINSTGAIFVPAGKSEAQRFEKDTTLYARWAGGMFNIKYCKTLSGCPETSAVSTQQCQYNPDSKPLAPTSGCIAQEPGDNIKQMAPTGNYFSYWQICEDSSCSNPKTVKPGEPLLVAPQTKEFETSLPVLRLIPHFAKCPAGYYCDIDGKHPCPMGSTSNEGSTAYTGCYLTPQTVFSDKTGEFSLPLDTFSTDPETGKIMGIHLFYKM